MISFAKYSNSHQDTCRISGEIPNGRTNIVVTLWIFSTVDSSLKRYFGPCNIFLLTKGKIRQRKPSEPGIPILCQDTG